MSTDQMSAEIEALKAKVNALHEQLAQHNSSVNKQLSDYSKKIQDTNQETHKIKHTVQGFDAHFTSFKELFVDQQKTMSQIRDSLLESNYEKRVTKLETFVEGITNIKEKMDDIKARLVVLEMEASDTKTFKTSTKAIISAITWIGLPTLIGVIGLVIKTFVK